MMENGMVKNRLNISILISFKGLIGSVASGAVDIGLADITITSGREKAVDFSIPYMQTGIQILYKPYRRMNTFSSIEDLVNQTDIKFGCVKGGSTEKFFKNSNNPVYRRAWEIMKENFQQKMSVNVEEVFVFSHKSDKSLTSKKFIMF